jgi:ephrin-B
LLCCTRKRFVEALGSRFGAMGNVSRANKKKFFVSSRASSNNIKYYLLHLSSRFRLDNTDHIIDVNQGNIPFEYDQVNIVCPSFVDGTNSAEQYIIYSVSKEEYDTCRITNPKPRIIAVCDRPDRLLYFTITFRSFTPQPGGLEFRPGQDYYFICEYLFIHSSSHPATFIVDQKYFIYSIATSSKEDLHRQVGGHCKSHNMKVIFKVCCKDETSPRLQSSSTATDEDLEGELSCTY